MDNNSTYVSSDSKTLMENIIASNPILNKNITEAKNEPHLFLCKVLRIYPYLDKVAVQLLNNGKEIMCRMTHDILDTEMSIRSINRGLVKTGKKTNATYVKPHDEIYGIVAKVRGKNYNEENCFISCVNFKNNSSLKNVVGDGEILLSVGSSKLSITDERTNILTPRLFINGLPYDSPELKNYFNEDEINIINEIVDARLSAVEGIIENLDIDSINQEINEILETLNNINVEIEWDSLKNKPVAFPPTTHTHSKNEILDFPHIFDGDYNELYNKPSLFSGSYTDLTNKPSFTPTITSSSDGAYKIGSININGSPVDIYGKDTNTVDDFSRQDYINDLDTAKTDNGSSEFRKALDNMIVAMTGRGDNF